MPFFAFHKNRECAGFAVSRTFPVPEPVGEGKAGMCLFCRTFFDGLGRFSLVGGVFGFDRFVMHQGQDGAFIVHEFELVRASI